jgi:hypothetical protein
MDPAIGAEQEPKDQEEHEKAYNARRPVAPTPAIAPTGQGANEDEEQNDNENEFHAYLLFEVSES